jgi:hypothetical protein
VQVRRLVVLVEVGLCILSQIFLCFPSQPLDGAYIIEIWWSLVKVDVQTVADFGVVGVRRREFVPLSIAVQCASIMSNPTAIFPLRPFGTNFVTIRRRVLLSSKIPLEFAVIPVSIDSIMSIGALSSQINLRSSSSSWTGLLTCKPRST